MISPDNRDEDNSILFLYPQLGLPHVSEPEPAMLSAAKAFESLNGQPGRSARFSLPAREGRAELEAPGHPYDLILVASADPLLPDGPRLLSRQFYASARRRLAPGGIVAHRLQIDSFSPAGLAMVARTAVGSFRHCGLARISDVDALLLASDWPLLASSNAVGLAQRIVDRQPELLADLNRFLGATNVAMLLATHLWLDAAGLRHLGAFGGDQTVISDWRWDAASSLTRSRSEDAQDAALPGDMIVAAAGLEGFKRNFTLSGCGPAQAAAAHQIAGAFAARQFVGMARNLVDWGLKLNPAEPDLIADRLIYSREEDPKAVVAALKRLENTSVDAAIRVGVDLWRRERFQEAILVFERLTKRYPQSATLWANLGVNYKAVGDLKRSQQCFARALALDPGNEFAKHAADRVVGSAASPRH